MWSYFTHKELLYNIRTASVLNLPITNSTYHATNTVHFTGTLIWNHLLTVIQSSQSLDKFEKKKKKIVDILTANSWYSNNQLFRRLDKLYIRNYLLVYLTTCNTLQFFVSHDAREFLNCSFFSWRWMRFFINQYCQLHLLFNFNSAL